VNVSTHVGNQQYGHTQYSLHIIILVMFLTCV